MIACSSTPISAELIKEADQNNVHLKAFPLCRDKVIAIVHPSNPVNQLSIEQVKGLFIGIIKNWADIGGHNASVNTILREETSGTHQVWDRMVLDGEHSPNNPVLVNSNSGVLAQVAENEHAIGYISAAYLNHEVKQLTITKNKEIAPIERTLFLYVDTKHFSKEIKIFISYLYSEPAKQIISENGFIPDPKTKPPTINL